MQSEIIELYETLTPFYLKSGSIKKPKVKDWQEGYHNLFMFTAGLYMGSKLDLKTIKKLLKIKD